VTITVSARAESFGRDIGKGQDFLKEASYRFEAVMPDGTRRIVGEVNISVPPPGAAGAPVVDVRGGSAGIWSLQ
jgi:hypothetical protein